ncbi:DUF4301 family protein [Formosa sediminum]|uniref:DUF4301 family protein n=1 Tax=Formosa sediminum TaxID=2594004 RepID=A0A516GQ48_9FLAO|nr:DUF4301 family protein [Formosa sediminum]QDO93490.1 DUF4301 family protein [Formosa sediminum]
MNFSEKDLKYIDKKGLTLQKIDRQIQQFQDGIPFIDLESPAIINHGILKFDQAERDAYVNAYDAKRDTLSVLKFVPASGAATRMFKNLFNFVANFNPEGTASFSSYVETHNDKNLETFFKGLEQLPFYDVVMDVIAKNYPDYESFNEDKKKWIFVNVMLDEKFLDYGAYPKGLLPFHKYKDHLATAFEEHLFEAESYASANGKANLHFTISETHNDKFNAEFEKIKPQVEETTGLDYNISFSYQKQSTDTIALTPEKEPFREADGSLLFRPSGHGALIENLNDLDADVIFIKNIDNVVVSKYKENIIEYKKVLAGVLLGLQDQAFKYLNELDRGEADEAKLIEIAEFLKRKLNVDIAMDFERFATTYQIEYLQEKLNKPIRVCGMVKNEGEPGGGPFWVEDLNGNLSLQIVESAQIDLENKIQKDILNGSTHFNPVDLVCGTKDYQGNAFDLLKFVDPKTGFITQKTKEGKALLALELPGLWNGAMANWNTVFVEVPLNTFNPVKTVADLLKPMHQN